MVQVTKPVKDFARALVRVPLVILHRLGRFFISARGVALLIVLFIVLVVAYFAISNRHAPYTSDAYVQAYVIQVAARIDGQVTEVLVVENQSVVAGQPLFRIDPRPYQHRVEVLQAKLVLAKSQVTQLNSELAATKAEVDRVVAEDEYAEQVFQQESAIFMGEATTERRYLDAVQKRKAARAARAKHVAMVKKTEEALAAMIGTEHALVAEVEALLRDARLNLEWTTIVSPVNGYVTNVMLQPGAYAYSGKPVMTCIDSQDWWVVANLRENGLENVRAGQTVGLTFNTYPGRVFPGVIESIGWGVEEGQGVPSGALPVVPGQRAWLRPAQRFQLRVRPDVPPEVILRVGSTATATVYANPDHEISDLARAWQQLVAWFDYLY